MAYDRRPNTGTLFESRPGGKTDFNGTLNVDGKNFTVFGRKKTVGKDKKFNIIELSTIPKRDAPQSSVPSTQPEGDLPF